MTFRVGQKVVCISRADNWDQPALSKHGFRYPEIGHVYTVRDIGPGYNGYARSGDLPCIRVREIINPTFDQWYPGVGEPNFFAHRFRPLVEKKTDISIFQKMLLPAKQKEEA